MNGLVWRGDAPKVLTVWVGSRQAVPLHTSYRTGQKSVGQTMSLRDRPRGMRDRAQIYRAGSPACPTALSGMISVTCATA
eukprot:359006-Chlamydomonas_euryale.AAC.11